MALVFMQKSKLQFVLLSFIALVLLFQPNKWNRSGHEKGLFRTRSFDPNFHFKSFFTLPEKNRNVAFFKDGPNTTVSLLKYSFTGTKNVKNSVERVVSHF